MAWLFLVCFYTYWKCHGRSKLPDLEDAERAVNGIFMIRFQMMTQNEMFKTVVLAALTAFCSAAFADARMPQIFSDGMVLQREMPVPVWGWAGAGEEVTIEFGVQKKTAKADAEGKWMVKLDPLKVSSEPMTMTVSSSKISKSPNLQIKNILVGEVWVSVGQSNMMMGLNAATGGPAFFEKTQPTLGDRVRVVHCTGPGLHSDTPRDDAPAKWGKATSGYSAVSYWFAAKLFEHFKGEVPVGMITYLDIAPTETWIDRETLAADPRLKPTLKDALNVATKSYNGVVAGLAPYATRGVIWYQAEYNGGRGEQYRTMMPALIQCWRKAWQKPELPFIFVQLPGFIMQKAKNSAIDMDAKTLSEYKKQTAEKTWTVIREAQLLTWLKTPHTGMAITIDIGEPYDIHPPNKEPVAQRLFLQARHVAYGEDLVYSGPVPAKTEIRDGGFVVSFNHVGGGLTAKGGELKGFEVAGSDMNFASATAEIKGNQVLVRCPAVDAPVHLRYAWDGCPDATLYNKEGLPGTPFRWTDWTRSPMSDHAEFAFPNSSFEELDKDGKPFGWKLGPNTQLAARQAPEEKRCIEMTEAKKSGVSVIKLIDGAGSYWNCPPERPAVRAGCLVGYSVEIATLPGSGEQKCYMNLSQGELGCATETWGGTRDISTASETFVTRSIAQRLTDQIPDYLFIYPLSPCARFNYVGGAKPGGLMFDKLSTVKILRPTLEFSVTKSLDLGQVPLGTAKMTESITIRNSQQGVFRQVLRDNDPGAEFSTVLYGAASFAPDGLEKDQKVVAKTDHVGAVLIGKDADKFEFVSDHCGATKLQLKLVGADGQGGLTGGPAPETETFSVRFLGTEKAGDYQATLRVVTQAGNIGTMSQGGQGEPPANLYYVDIPVTVKVKP
jgi:sialate O-acetylesterase